MKLRTKFFLVGILLGIIIYCSQKAIEEYKPIKQQEEVKEMVSSYIQIPVQNPEENEIEEIKIDWEGLRSVNEDIVGYIDIPDTVISYPIVKGDEFYLKHAYDKSYNTHGSIFIDTNANLSDESVIIYGHSVVNSDLMFSTIRNYEDSDYHSKHKYVYITTPELGEKKYEVKLMLKVSSDSEYYQNYKLDEQTVILSTCDLDYGLHSEQRIILILEEVPQN